MADGYMLNSDDGEMKVIVALSTEEAATLKHICGSVVGSPERSRRRHTDEVWRVLMSIPELARGFGNIRSEGNVSFQNDTPGEGLYG
jgi:hypothetical protein